MLQIETEQLELGFSAPTAIDRPSGFNWLVGDRAYIRSIFSDPSEIWTITDIQDGRCSLVNDDGQERWAYIYSLKPAPKDYDPLDDDFGDDSDRTSVLEQNLVPAPEQYDPLEDDFGEERSPILSAPERSDPLEDDFGEERSPILSAPEHSCDINSQAPNISSTDSPNSVREQAICVPAQTQALQGSCVAPEHSLIGKIAQWTERYPVKRGNREHWYYRYLWMGKDRKIHRRHIPGNASSEKALIILGRVQGAIASGQSPLEIEKMMKEWKRG